MARWAIIAISSVALCAGCGGRSKDNETGRPALVVTDADSELKTSRVVATLNEPMRDGLSPIWCSTMQLAFDALKAELGPPLRVDPANPAVQAMIDAPPAAGHLDPESYLAMAGFGRDEIVGAIRKALHEKFGSAASPAVLPENVPPDHLLAYSYLAKSLAFEFPLLRGEWSMTFQDASVAWFGWYPKHGRRDSKAAERIGQFKVLHYVDRENWSMQITTKKPEDRLIVARAAAAPAGTLAEAVAHILAQSSPSPSGGEALDWSEEFGVPVINFDVTRSYRELDGANLIGVNGAGPIDESIQNIRFRLDEKGAVLQTDARSNIKSAPGGFGPREFICDGPFFVIMMRADAAEPYFVGYFATPELLVPFKD